ncbi:hypothetical protein T05_7054 [Trichinella murrelli]|uniref:Uncharacterized protein n=1 Tax=Trichinella murrelli TaxID=144512 RepID=A0A0V0UBS4_9BILA|nr:hypothetical protein T05_7054 [Trichinella murrelli]
MDVLKLVIENYLVSKKAWTTSSAKENNGQFVLSVQLNFGRYLNNALITRFVLSITANENVDEDEVPLRNEMLPSTQ